MDPAVVDKVRRRYRQLKSEGKLLDERKLASFYDVFRRRFAPEVLSKLEGEALTEYMHDLGNQGSLAYWLDFKSDDEFDTLRLGSIKGGTPLKFNLYRSKGNDAWMGRGSKSNPVEIPAADAIEIATRHRDQLLAGCELLDAMPEAGSAEDYATLQRGMDERAPDVSGLARGHKYFSVLYPTLLDDYHNAGFQRFHLIKLEQVPPDSGERYLPGEQFARLARELDAPMANLTTTLNDMHPSPHRYWRFIANYRSLGDAWINWEEMHRESFAGIGWGELGDLSHIGRDGEGKKNLQAKMRDIYGDRGRWTSEIYNFLAGIKPGDVVVATEGETMLGCGVVESGHYHVEGSQIPHRRDIKWLSNVEWSLPVEEGKGRAIGELKNRENLVRAEEMMRSNGSAGVDTPVSSTAPTTALNRILYGVPGSGKTFSVQRRAVEIIESGRTGEGTTDEEIAARFRRYVQSGRVAFVTFHQSYSYEEFVEGFRFDPETQIPTLHKGIFQSFAERAASPPQGQTPVDGAKVWKISLETADQRYLFDRSLQNSEISIGWLEREDLSDSAALWEDQPRLFEDQLRLLFDEHHPGSSPSSVLNFVSRMQIGDYVAVRGSETTIRAIGVVTGDYEFNANYDEQPHTRSVQWLDTEVHDILQINGGKRLVRQTLYELTDVSVSDLAALVPRTERENRPYVLVIDEINRGNISRIFGELITLLEPDKRRGASSELTVTLPYSGGTFSVPSNLYVIGTMNSTDRSIALIDTALRRRFRFEEVKPDSSVIRRVLKAKCRDVANALSTEQIELVCLTFDRLNARIRALLDADHQIGHGYFLDAITPKDLHVTLYEKVLPLLGEYFYNDHERLSRLVGEYGSAAGGFVEYVTEQYGPGFSLGDEDEVAWEFHVYDEGELVDALRRTFN